LNAEPTYWEADPERIVKIGNRYLREVGVAISDEWFDQIKQGYRCLACFEPQREAFPEKCHMRGCGYKIRKYQADELERHVRNVEMYEPPDELPTEERARRAGIIVPRAIA